LITGSIDGPRSTFEAHGSTDRQPRWSLGALAIVVVLMIGVAVAGRIRDETPSSASGPPAVAQVSSPSTVILPDEPTSSAPGPARLPASIACGAIGASRCRQLVRAGAELLPGQEEAFRAEVYPSLVCGDDVDCPRTFLESGSPAGSVILTLGDGASVWVNVVLTESPPQGGKAPGRFVARLVRWFPPDA
jgi:hypothetical protein